MKTNNKLTLKHRIAQCIWSFLAAGLVLSLLSSPVMAVEERIIQFRSIEDPTYPPDPSVCEAAPFSPVTTRLGASLWSFQSRSSDGMVVNDRVQRIGNATACAQIQSLSPFTYSPFYIKISLKDGDYIGEGTCTAISNDLPAGIPYKGVVLAGCTLKLVNAPPDVIGGAVTSMSVFNPFGVPGYNTGSIWTLHLFKM